MDEWLLWRLARVMFLGLLLSISYLYAINTHSHLLGIISVPGLVNLVLLFLFLMELTTFLKKIWRRLRKDHRIVAYAGMIMALALSFFFVDDVMDKVGGLFEKIEWRAFWPFSPVKRLTVPSNGLIAHYIHQKINEIRVSKGLKALEWDRKLAEISYYHSNNMARYGFFDHVDHLGNDPTERASYFGYFCKKYVGDMIMEGIGENLFMLENYDGTEEEIARIVVDGWMNSPGHRRNILDPYYEKEGIGVVVVGNKIYVTQNFC